MNDFFRRAFERALVLSASKRVSTSLSDNQAYPQFCMRASINYRSFNNFRRHPIYTDVLEHVTEQQGTSYLEAIGADAEILANLEAFKENDRWGNPRLYKYAGIGFVSPSTLRYVKVLKDLKEHFRNLDDLRICEIGVGYGGQCRIINAMFRPSAYVLVDIKAALALAQRFLDNYAVHSALSYKTMNELEVETYDLVISNYAFTEIPRTFQEVYLEKVILRSTRGYITYNEITPPAFRSFKAHELIEMIPGSRILKEEPLTHPKNCIIIWGASA